MYQHKKIVFVGVEWGIGYSEFKLLQNPVISIL
jgi:hypothetical protein